MAAFSDFGAANMHTTHSIPLPDGGTLVLGPRPVLMGILNVTPDSFSDGGRFNLVNEAVSHARAMVAEGADIIDIGGESTRPGAETVSVQEELDRVIPVIEALVAEGIGVPLSIDSYKPLVADQAIQSGASIINDVHGLQGDPDMAAVAALHKVPVIAMHWDRARDATEPLREAVRRYFDTTIALAEKNGIDADRLILDPGYGFAKTVAENYALLRDLREIYPARPMLVGTSRKSMIGKLLGNEPHERLAGTIATTVLGYMGGGHIFRVHDIRPNRDALRVAQATLYGLTEESR